MPALVLTLVVMALLCISFAVAGSIEGLNYKDRACCHTYYRTINDGNVEVDADTVEGYGVDALLKDEVGGSGGISYGNMLYFLTGNREWAKFGNYLEYLATEFAPWDEIDRLEARIQRLELEAGLEPVELKYAQALIKANRLNHAIVTDDGFTCEPGEVSCYKLSDMPTRVSGFFVIRE